MASLTRNGVAAIAPQPSAGGGATTCTVGPWGRAGALLSRQRQIASLWMCLVPTLLAGCGGGAGDAARLRAAAEPHLAAFERFDRWARRTLDADLALRDPVALEEALFAPIRREEPVVFAWVERVGPDPRSAGFRVDEAPELSFVGLRAVPMLSGLEAGRTTLADPRDRQTRTVPRELELLVLRRTAPSGRGAGQVRVWLAYLAAPASNAAER